MTVYPFADLERLLTPSWASIANDGATRYVGRRLGVASKSVCRYRRTGLSPDVADCLATAAGYHPATVWPDWWEDAGEPTGCLWCGDPWVPPGRKTCSDECRHALRAEQAELNARSRRWWARVERYREAAARDPELRKVA